MVDDCAPEVWVLFPEPYCDYWEMICMVGQDGAPPLGWGDTISYLVLPVLLVVSQYISMQMMQPPQVYYHHTCCQGCLVDWYCISSTVYTFLLLYSTFIVKALWCIDQDKAGWCFGNLVNAHIEATCSPVCRQMIQVKLTHSWFWNFCPSWLVTLHCLCPQVWVFTGETLNSFVSNLEDGIEWV